MDILGIIWLDAIVEKPAVKHHVDPDEDEQLFHHTPRILRLERGNVEGEDLYSALGRTDNGRMLTVFFIHKRSGEALIISARDTTPKERGRYGRK
jgi:uncharacterized DUF497 family protein